MISSTASSGSTLRIAPAPLACFVKDLTTLVGDPLSPMCAGLMESLISSKVMTGISFSYASTMPPACIYLGSANSCRGRQQARQFDFNDVIAVFILPLYS